MPECATCGDVVRVPDGYEFKEGVDECWECERKKHGLIKAELAAWRAHYDVECAHGTVGFKLGPTPLIRKLRKMAGPL